MWAGQGLNPECEGNKAENTTGPAPALAAASWRTQPAALSSVTHALRKAEVCTLPLASDDLSHQGAGSPVQEMQPSYGPTNVGNQQEERWRIVASRTDASARQGDVGRPRTEP